MDYHNTNVLVSIIIPTYNTPKQFFKECIESLANQSYRNLEIIIIDDGSAKDFAEYYDKLVAQYPEKSFTVFHRKNSGVSASRNFGIEHAQGEYLIFVDSDDIAGKYYVETLLSLVLQFHSDIAMCTFKRFVDKKEIVNRDDKSSGKIFYQENESIWKSPFFTSYLWDKIFSKNLFSNTLFHEELSCCEDVLLTNTLLSQSPVCPVIQEQLYYYRINPSSITETPNAKKYKHSMTAYELVKALPTIQKYPDAMNRFTINCCRYQLRYMATLMDERSVGWKDEFQKIRKVYLDDILPFKDHADTKFMKFSIPIIKQSETTAFVYLWLVSSAQKFKRWLRKIKNKKPLK